MDDPIPPEYESPMTPMTPVDGSGSEIQEPYTPYTPYSNQPPTPLHTGYLETFRTDSYKLSIIHA